MENCVLALGFFDGVHLGHGGLLRMARKRADEKGLTAACVTFDRHPAALVRGNAPPLLNTAEERAVLMKQLYGMDRVQILPFDEKLRQEPWEQFAQRMVHNYGARHIICGYDFRFGMDGAGDAQRLRSFCEERELGFDCIDKITLDGTTVSSTHIRTLLLSGKTEEAVHFLGHGHLLTGTVVDGKKIGRTLGIPTANMELSEGILIPKTGVYAAKAQINGAYHPAVVNIGYRPTFRGKQLTVEPWILDFNEDLYGKLLQLFLYRYLRPEQKFSSPEDLKAEILRNAQQTRALYQSTGL